MPGESNVLVCARRQDRLKVGGTVACDGYMHGLTEFVHAVVPGGLVENPSLGVGEELWSPADSTVPLRCLHAEAKGKL